MRVNGTLDMARCHSTPVDKLETRDNENENEVRSESVRSISFSKGAFGCLKQACSQEV